MLARMRMSAGKWAELVGEWETSGRPARTVAEEHGVTESSLRWWKSELARRARNQPARRSPGPGRNGNRDVALARVVREGEMPPTSDGVVIAIGSARILVQHNFDAQLLRAVVRAFSEGP